MAYLLFDEISKAINRSLEQSIPPIGICLGPQEMLMLKVRLSNLSPTFTDESSKNDEYSFEGLPVYLVQKRGFQLLYPPWRSASFLFGKTS